MMQQIKTILEQNSFENQTSILRALSQAHRHLGELKGIAKTLPNEAMLVNTLGLQEAQDSSEIENIVTTHDELYRHLADETPKNTAAKEVTNYANALHFLYKKQHENKCVTINMLNEAQSIIIGNNAGLRKQTGTVLRNEKTGKTVYTPPKPNDIPALFNDLELFINIESESDIDPLIKMAIIHHQFESIHPYHDGNGRIGRILNIIYLIQTGLLDTPILYLSRYINHNKQQYYALLQAVRDEKKWIQWVLYIINGIAQTAQSTNNLVTQIRTLQQRYKLEIRKSLPKLYSHDLLNNIFSNPYTKTTFLQKDLNVSRFTATRYLDQLAEKNFLKKIKQGRNNYYLNTPLIKVLRETDDLRIQND